MGDNPACGRRHLAASKRPMPPHIAGIYTVTRSSSVFSFLPAVGHGVDLPEASSKEIAIK